MEGHLSLNGFGRWVRRPNSIAWLPAFFGLAVMYLPSFIQALETVWSTEKQGHGPIVLAVALWLLYRQRTEVLAEWYRAPRSMMGGLMFALSLLFYLLGRSQQVLLLELGSFPLMLAALCLLLFSPRALKLIAFPVFFLCFMVPLPGMVVDALTQPMKLAVSHVVEWLLYLGGLPVARSGVVLQVGQYQLFVADACAGLQTLFTLEAVGLLYLYLVQHPSRWRNIFLGVSIIPISFVANVIRVSLICLITYFLGDEAGQGFLHFFAGIVLFGAAVGMIFLLDNLTQRFSDWRQHKPRDGDFAR